MTKIIERTNDPVEFELLCKLNGNIEVWLHDKETTVPIRRFRRSEYFDQFEKVRGYLATFTNEHIIDIQIENDKYNFYGVGSEWYTFTRVDNHRVKITIEGAEIKLSSWNDSNFKQGENVFNKLHPVDKEKVIKYLKGLKKFVLENVKNETLRGLVEKCFESEVIN